MGDNIESYNQSGGITAKSVTFEKPSGKGDSHRIKGRWKKFGSIIGILASIVTLLSYFGFKPGGWFMDKKTVNITSHNQSGGITAGTVNVGNADRQVTPQLASKLGCSLPSDKSLRTIIITPTHNDAETLRFANKLKVHLLSLGYQANVFNGVIAFAKKDWPADVNIVLDKDETVKEIIVTPIK